MVFEHPGPVSSADAWAGAFAFAVQIYGDFFGYMSCAIAAALCLGYELPRNFMAPYRSAGFSDFWRRWHIRPESVASAQRVRVFVLSVNEAMLMSGVVDGTPLTANHGQRLEAATRDWFLEYAPIRSAYLGHHRLFRYLRTRLHMTAPTENSGWTWSGERRQWRYAGLEQREFVSLPTYRREHRDMAQTYYANKAIRPDARDVMASTLAVLSRNADKVVVLIPPSERAFQEDAESLAPGLRSQLFDLIKDAALRSGAQLIDCSAPDACGMHPSGFADPIHFNDRGIESYSQALAPLVAEALR